jgi:hypothetical protein
MGSIFADDVTGTSSSILLYKRLLNHLFFASADSLKDTLQEELTAIKVRHKLLTILGESHKLQVSVTFALCHRPLDNLPF